MRILFLSSEVAPWSKSGGLGDVAGALPEALAWAGHDVRVMTPLYPSVPAEHLKEDGPPLTLHFPFGERTARFFSETPEERFTVTFVQEPDFFGRKGMYVENGQDYGDNARRFAFFTVAALSGAQQRGFLPDIVHLNDWQTGLGALALKTGYQHTGLGQAKSVFTIHNLAYQGLFPKQTMDDLGLPWSHFNLDGLEYWNQLSFMKAGLMYADALTAVSPTYAREIQGPRGGMGLDGVLRSRSASLHGILNGINPHEWNPATDVLLPERYSVADLSGRAACRRALLERFGIEPPAEGKPLFATIGRMVDQKGVDLMQAALPPVLEHGACAVVLGEGEARFEEAWRALQRRFPGQLGVHVGFDNALAHLVEAGADFFLMPSRFEPCGLNQLYSMVYGAVPVVHAVGGLADTVVDLRAPESTGIVMQAPTVEALREALTRALDLYAHPEAYARVQRRAMGRDWSWDRAIQKYEAVYRGILPRDV